MRGTHAAIVVLAAAAGRAHADPVCADAGMKIGGLVWPGARGVTVCLDGDGGGAARRCLRYDLASGAYASAQQPDFVVDPDAPLEDTDARAITLCNEEGDACRTLVPPGYRPDQDRIRAHLDASRTRVAIEAGGHALAVYRIGDRLVKMATVRPPERRYRDSVSGVFVGDNLLVRGARGEYERYWLVAAKSGKVLRAIGGDVHYEDPLQPVHTDGAVAYLDKDGLHVVRSDDGKALATVDTGEIYGAHAAAPTLAALPGDQVIVVYEQGLVVVDARTGAHTLARIPACAP
jgi:hypothetical protein